MSNAEQAGAVVIGGGITGCSVAYHLAKAGVRDVRLVEKGELTSGSTCHAAGLVTQFNPSPTMMRFRRYSIELYRELGVFETVGSLRFASSQEQLMELHPRSTRGARQASRNDPLGTGAAGDGLETVSKAAAGGPWLMAAPTRLRAARASDFPTGGEAI